MTASIRKVRASDLRALVNIDENLFGVDSFSSYSMRQFINLFPESFFVADKDECLVGYAAIGVKPFSKEAWLISIGVLKPHQNCGIGTSLLTSCDEYCRKSRIGSCRLTTDLDNLSAIRLYERAGFKPESELQDYYEPDDRKMLMVKGYESQRS